ncbi:MAG: dicarboxylate/amino acid:cation symporter [Planctomycetota bacterium]
MPRLALHWWILLSMVVGVVFGFVAVQLGIGDEVGDVLKPVGKIFLNLLKMIAVPLVFFSLVAGVASLNDTAKLGRIGGKTIGLYLGTTAVAITIGLIVVNLIGPGKGLDEATRNSLLERGRQEKAFERVREQDASQRVDPRVFALRQLADGLRRAEEQAGQVDTSAGVDRTQLLEAADRFDAAAELAEARVKAELAEDSSGGGVSIVDELVKIVPTNPFESLATAEMLQVVFFSLLLGVALVRLAQTRPEVQKVVDLFQILADAVIDMVTLIMKIAPIGVFALLATLVTDLGRDVEALQDIAGALLSYMAAVVLALALHGLIVYGSLLAIFTKVKPLSFLKAMAPAQLLAFSSSSSGATLPVTIRCVEENLGVDEEVSSFVLPLGATINMDGTGLYQGVAAVFIANVMGYDLDFADQVSIVLTAALASIGTAAVPGVGIVLLTIVLAKLNIPLEGIALILGVDRPLDMCRTVLNVSGDATVTTVVASSEGMLHAPKPPATMES